MEVKNGGKGRYCYFHLFDFCKACPAHIIKSNEVEILSNLLLLPRIPHPETNVIGSERG